MAKMTSQMERIFFLSSFWKNEMNLFPKILFKCPCNLRNYLISVKYRGNG